MKFRFSPVVLLVLSIAAVTAVAQTRPKKATAPAATQVVPTLMASLPESDGVADVKVRQLLNEVLPQLLATNPTKLAEINADIDRFKTRTGLDPRMFDELAMGVTYSYPAEGITKLHTAALAKGQFSSGAMIAAGRVAANGKYREEKYQGKTIYVFNIDESIKVLGLFDFSVREIAAAPLNTNTLALGDPTTIRNVIDVAGGRKRNNADLIALASREPNAIIGFGSNLSPTLIKNLDVGNASIAADLSGLRQVYGSVGTTPRDFDIFLGARTVNADAARNLGDTLEGLKQLGGLFVGRLSGAKGVLAKSALSNLKISTQANELQIRTAVAQAELAPLVGN